ncbi:MAG: GTPase HflX [Candidatus Lindowbacteria bacterium]|nr:GTPase HflX [Candidatus Lindowbacteria bacterium]
MYEIKQNANIVERALIVGIQKPRDTEEHVGCLLDELEALVGTLDINVVCREIVRVKEIKPKLLVGSGRADDIAALVAEHECDVVVFDDELTPGQQRNWEKKLEKIAVIDRQEIILDIFAMRAQTKEAVLQVGLARMEYSLPRLKRAWTHLSRQRGGGTTQRDTGETQLETDQRLVRDKISRLKRELADIVRNRDVQRKQRLKLPTPTAAIVGYTNAGKSSLLNCMTGADVLAEDKLFATLDSTTRRINLPGGHPLLLTDTVGFVRRLPHHLVEAFKATLEEALYSNFLVHILDLSNPEVEEHFETTMKVLEELNASGKNIITVFNKIDKEPEPDQQRRIKLKALKLKHPGCIFVSTKTGDGIKELELRMEKLLEEDFTPMDLIIPHSRYDLIHELHQLGCIKSEEPRDDGVFIQGNIPSSIRHMVNEFRVK